MNSGYSSELSFDQADTFTSSELDQARAGMEPRSGVDMPDPEVKAVQNNGSQRWFKLAACLDVSVTFYPNDKPGEAKAKEICLTCPVQKDCLDYAIQNKEKFGIWGGLNEKERKKVKNKD